MQDYGALAMELALGGQPIADICEAYKTNEEMVEWLIDSSPAFQAAMKEAMMTIKATGKDAGFVLRARYLAEKHLRTADEIASSTEVNPSVRLHATESLVAWARLAPTPEKNVSPGTQVIINMDPAGFINRPAAPVVEMPQ